MDVCLGVSVVILMLCIIPGEIVTHLLSALLVAACFLLLSMLLCGVIQNLIR